MPEVDVNKNVYKCSACKTIFNWNDESSWYGSLKDMDEDSSKLKYSCSSKCKKVIDNQLGLIIKK